MDYRALVLATQAKEEQATKRNDSSKLTTGPRNRIGKGGPVNADGTPRSDNRIAVDARKSLRITALCHFLFLENEGIAGSITLTVIQVSNYAVAEPAVLAFSRQPLILMLVFLIAVP